MTKFTWGDESRPNRLVKSSVKIEKPSTEESSSSNHELTNSVAIPVVQQVSVPDSSKLRQKSKGKRHIRDLSLMTSKDICLGGFSSSSSVSSKTVNVSKDKQI